MKMKKFLCVILVCLLVTGMAACSGKPANEQTESFKVAIMLPDSGPTFFTIMSNNMRKLAGLMGGEAVFEGVSMSADAQISFVESQISAGVKGLVLCPASDTMLPTVKNLCEEAGVYWGLTWRSILDDEIRNMVEGSKYYVGNCYENEIDAGYSVMKHINSLGMKKVAIISTVKGDTTGDQREQGITQACNEFGMEVVAEARGLEQASDATGAAESFLTAYNDLDCIFVVARSCQIC